MHDSPVRANSIPSDSTTSSAPIPNLTVSGGMRIAFWACVVIGAAAVLRRIFAIAIPPRSGPPPLVALDSYFAAHAHLTLAHVLLALAFVGIAPLVVLWPGRSAWAEKLIYPLGVLVSLTAYAMSVHAVGGWLERSAVLVFNTLFLFSLARAFAYQRVGDALRGREWLLRAIAILLAVATTRPVMGIFFATSPLTHLQPQQFFGIAFWIGWLINTIGIEWWLRSRKALAGTLAHARASRPGSTPSRMAS
jgi:hypothetical protein